MCPPLMFTVMLYIEHALGDLKRNIEYIIGMERLSGNIDTPTLQDIARILNVSVEEVRQRMKKMVH